MRAESRFYSGGWGAGFRQQAHIEIFMIFIFRYLGAHGPLQLNSFASLKLKEVRLFSSRLGSHP